MAQVQNYGQWDESRILGGGFRKAIVFLIKKKKTNLSLIAEWIGGIHLLPSVFPYWTKLRSTRPHLWVKPIYHQILAVLPTTLCPCSPHTLTSHQPTSMFSQKMPWDKLTEKGKIQARFPDGSYQQQVNCSWCYGPLRVALKDGGGEKSSPAGGNIKHHISLSFFPAKGEMA